MAETLRRHPAAPSRGHVLSRPRDRLPARQAEDRGLHARRRHRHAARRRRGRTTRRAGLWRGQAGVLPAVPVLHRIQDRPAVLSRPQERRPAAGGAVDRSIATTGLIVAYAVSRLFGYDAGTAAGVIAGALTESATIGTASDAIRGSACPRPRRGDDQPHSGVVRRDLPDRRRRRGVVPGAARAAADGHQPRGGMPPLRTRDAGAGRSRRPRTADRLAGLRRAGQARPWPDTCAGLEQLVREARLFVERMRRDGAIMRTGGDHGPAAARSHRGRRAPRAARGPDGRAGPRAPRGGRRRPAERPRGHPRRRRDRRGHRRPDAHRPQRRGLRTQRVRQADRARRHVDPDIPGHRVPSR